MSFWKINHNSSGKQKSCKNTQTDRRAPTLSGKSFAADIDSVWISN